MRTILDTKLCFCIIVSICFITISSSTEGNFLVVPDEDITVLEGDQVVLSCILLTSSTFLSATAFWETGLSSVVTPSDNTEINSTLNGTSQSITSQVIFHSVRREMDNYYRCSILVTFDWTQKVFHSTFGKLTVHFFPRGGDLSCQGPRSPILTEGSNAVFKCKGIQCNPPILLEWRKQELEAFGIIANFSTDNTLLTGRVMVTPFLNSQVLHCFAKSDAFPGRSVNCTIGPLNVHFAPVVQVFSLINSELRPPLVRQSELTCQAEGNPAIVTYNWSCQPTALIFECKANGKILTVALSPSSKEASTLNITCEASNSVGSSLNSLQLNVTPVAMEMIISCNQLPSLGSSDGQDLYIGFDIRHTKSLTCLALVTQIEPVFFRWYMNGYKVSEGQGIHDSLDFLNGNRQIIVQDTLNMSRKGTITCEMQSGVFVKRVYCMLGDVNSTDVTTKGIDIWETENDRMSPKNRGQPDETTPYSSESNARENAGPSHMFLTGLIASIVGFTLLFGSVLIAVFLFRAARRRNIPPPGALQLSTVTATTPAGQGQSSEHVCASTDPLYESISERNSGENISPLRGLPDRSLEYAISIVKSQLHRHDTNSSDEAPSSIDQVPIEGRLRDSVFINSSEGNASQNEIIYQNTQAMPQVLGKGNSPYFWSKVNQGNSPSREDK